MKHIGQPQGHWFRSSGVFSRTQVLPISLLCHPSLWGLWTQAGSKMALYALWQVQVQCLDLMRPSGGRETTFSYGFLRNKDIYPKKPPNPFAFSMSWPGLSCLFIAEPVIGTEWDYIWTHQAHLRTGVDSGSRKIS